MSTEPDTDFVKTLEKYIETERESARKRTTVICVTFVVILLLTIATFCAIGFLFINNFMTVNSRLLDVAIPAQQQPAQPQVIYVDRVAPTTQTTVPTEVTKAAPLVEPAKPATAKIEPTQPVQPATPQIAPTPAPAPTPTKTEQPQAEPPKVQAPKVEPPKVTPAPMPKPEPKPVPAKPKELAPKETGKETPAPNGQATQTITLPVGDEEIPWQTWTQP